MNDKPQIVLVKESTCWKAHYKGSPSIKGMGSNDKSAIRNLERRNPDPPPYNESLEDEYTEEPDLDYDIDKQL